MTLAQMSLSGAAVIAAVALVRPFAVDALPKRILPLLWGLALARLLIPVPAPDGLSLPRRMAWVERVPSAYQAAREALADTGEGENTDGLADAATENVEEQLDSIPETVAAVEGPSEPVETAEPVESIVSEELMEPGGTASVAPSRPFPLYTVWGAGTGVLFLLFAAAWVRFRRRFQRSWPPEDPAVRDWLERWTARQGLRRPVSVRVCGEIRGPLTYGLLCPVILLPSATDWTDRPALEFVLYHELVHVRRFDAAYKLALAAALCVHWCNPCVWLLYGLAGRDLELACDEAVVRRFGREARLPYVNTLLDMESRKSGFAVPQFSARAAQERVAAVMKTRPLTLPARLISCALALAVGLLAVSASPPASARLREEQDETAGQEAAERLSSADEQAEEPAPLRTVKVSQGGGFESFEEERKFALIDADRVAREVPVPGGVLLCAEKTMMRDFRGHGIHQTLTMLGTDGTVTTLPVVLDADMEGRYENILIENIQYNPKTRTVAWQVRTTAYPDGETDTCSYVWEIGSSTVDLYAAWEAWEERALEIRSGFESSHYTEDSFQ